MKKYQAVIEPELVETKSVYTSFIEKYHRHVTRVLFGDRFG